MACIFEGLGRYLGERNLYPPEEVVQSLRKQGFKIEEAISSTKYSDVYLLVNHKMGQKKVLKLHKEPVYFDENRGIHLISGIRHPGINVPEQFFYRTDEGKILSYPDKKSKRIVTILPYVEGQTLAEVWPEIVKSKKVFQFLLELISVGKAVWEKGIDHGNLEADHIVIDSNGKPVIINFDCALKNEKIHLDGFFIYRAAAKLLMETRSSRLFTNNSYDLLVLCILEIGDQSKVDKLFIKRIEPFLKACVAHLDEFYEKKTIAIPSKL